MNKIHNLKVGVSGVRGIVGDTFTPSLVAAFAASYGEYVGGGRVIVGRDTRPSGPMIEHAVIAGLVSVGCQPILAGIIPTPTIQIAVDEYHANGAIAITASHNTAEWNALKFINSSGIFFNETEAAELLDVYNQPDNLFVKEQDYRSVRAIDDAFELHQKRIFRNINVEAIRKARFKIAVDCCNGVGALYARPFLEELGCEVISIFDEADGNFRRRPEPVPQNLSELCRVVRENGCAAGFAQDPDGDRIALIKGNGKAAGEQYSIVLAAEHVLSKTPGNVVVNIQTTKAVEDVAAKYGCKVFYSTVGEINVTRQMLAVNSIIGGEGSSGGVIWPAVHPCRDSFAAMALFLEMMALRSESIDTILDKLPQYHSKTLKFPCSAFKSQQIIRHLRAKYAQHNPVTIDGIRINFDDAWILVRSSNTEPLMRLTTEARSISKAEKLAADFSKEISALLTEK
ncbi:MAG: phosphoglucosamine mutase [Lentisphaerae bacterium GWF2_44_16]|nr:MAG: phosphoglucosamine mutase [Lentisphaerae bacterium GWF2_44_16]